MHIHFSRPNEPGFWCKLGRLRKVGLALLRKPCGRINPRLVVLIFFTVIFVFSATMLTLDYAREAREENALKELAAAAADGTSAIKTPAAVLPQYRELYRQNTDLAGWIKIDGTEIDYPVMYTPENGDFYLTHGFDKAESKSGVPFIDKRCKVEPLGTNTIIYGHHMKNGTMFAGLVRYEEGDYYQEHPIIRFDTLYARQEYEIIAVFKSRIYKKSDQVFKHYNFLNARSKADFDEYIAHIKALSLYDTGVTASYGDKLLTLVTCSYHTDHGQFVVVAKKIPVRGAGGQDPGVLPKEAAGGIPGDYRWG
jgi:sortase B